MAGCCGYVPRERRDANPDNATGCRKEQPMSESSKIDALYVEYPFLEQHVPKADVYWKARVERMDAKLLDRCAGYILSSGRKLCLLDQEGALVKKIGGFLNYQTVAQAFAKSDSKENRRIRYALFFDGGQLTFFKPPKGFETLEDIRQADLKAERAALSAA